MAFGSGDLKLAMARKDYITSHLRGGDLDKKGAVTLIAFTLDT